MTKETTYNVYQSELIELALDNDKTIIVRVLADGSCFDIGLLTTLLKHQLSKNGWPAGFDKELHYFYVTRKPSLLDGVSTYIEVEPVMVVPFTAPTAKTPTVKKKSKPTKQHNRISIKEGI